MWASHKDTSPDWDDGIQAYVDLRVGARASARCGSEGLGLEAAFMMIWSNFLRTRTESFVVSFRSGFSIFIVFIFNL